MNEILNIIVIVLLTLAIIYGFILYRRISLIQESKKELANLFKSFDNTILKAQKSIEELKSVSGEISGGLQTKIDKAAIMIDDLEFLSEKATKVAKNLEDNFSTAAKREVRPQQAQNNNNNGLSPEEIIKLRQASSAREKLQAKTPANQGKINKDKAKALERLLENISKENKAESQSKQGSKNNQKSSANKEVVSDVLKALGYGE